MARSKTLFTEPPLCLTLLGSFQLERNGTPVKLPSQKTRALLAYLALFLRAHAREQLAALFWGDAPDKQARTSLRVALTTLYKLVGRERFIGDYETIELVNDGTLQVDALNFQAPDGTADSIPYLQSRISLYHGDLLPDLYDDWVLQERERLRVLYFSALEQLTAHYRVVAE